MILSIIQHKYPQRAGVTLQMASLHLQPGDWLNDSGW